MRMRKNEKIKLNGLVKGKSNKNENENGNDKKNENGHDNSENNENCSSQCDFSWIDIDLSQHHCRYPYNSVYNSSDSDNYTSRISKNNNEEEEEDDEEEREEEEEEGGEEDIDHDDHEDEERNYNGNLGINANKKRKRHGNKSNSNLLSSSSSSSLSSFQVADKYLNQLFELSDEGTYIIVLTQSSLLPLVQLISKKQR